MRVTKLIKDYVEKSVAKAMPDKKVPDCSAREEYYALEDEIKAFAEKKFDEFMSKHKGEVKAYYGGYDYDHSEETAHFVKKEFRVCFPSLKYKAEDDMHKENEEILKARKEAIENILINLELGGTKADLDRMIAELGKGE